MRALRSGCTTLVGTMITVLAALVCLYPGTAFGDGGTGNGGSGSVTTGWGSATVGHSKVTIGVGVNHEVPAPGIPPTPDPSTPPFYYGTTPCTECAMDGEVCLADGKLGLIPVAPGSDPLADLPAGDSVPVYVELISTVTGKVVGYAGETLCNPPVVPAPPPPNAEAVWRTVPLPVPQIEFNPGSYGVTQLPTWFWLANDTAGVDAHVSVPGGVDGYAVTVSVHPVAYNWSFGDGATAASSNAGGPGSSAAASVTHTFAEAGTFSVAVGVVWAGSYTFSGYGFTETVAIGPVDQAETVQPYTVQQIRSALAPSGSS